ncbi:hypothetical protein ACOME3_005846 [Neoechinorhynchus agilis]
MCEVDNEITETINEENLRLKEQVDTFKAKLATSDRQVEVLKYTLVDKEETMNKFRFLVKQKEREIRDLEVKVLEIETKNDKEAQAIDQKSLNSLVLSQTRSALALHQTMDDDAVKRHQERLNALIGDTFLTKYAKEEMAYLRVLNSLELVICRSHWFLEWLSSGIRMARIVDVNEEEFNLIREVFKRFLSILIGRADLIARNLMRQLANMYDVTLWANEVEVQSCSILFFSVAHFSDFYCPLRDVHSLNYKIQSLIDKYAQSALVHSVDLSDMFKLLNSLEVKCDFSDHIGHDEVTDYLCILQNMSSLIVVYVEVFNDHRPPNVGEDTLDWLNNEFVPMMAELMDKLRRCTALLNAFEPATIEGCFHPYQEGKPLPALLKLNMSEQIKGLAVVFDMCCVVRSLCVQSDSIFTDERFGIYLLSLSSISNVLKGHSDFLNDLITNGFQLADTTGDLALRSVGQITKTWLSKVDEAFEMRPLLYQKSLEISKLEEMIAEKDELLQQEKSKVAYFDAKIKNISSRADEDLIDIKERLSNEISKCKKLESQIDSMKRQYNAKLSSLERETGDLRRKLMTKRQLSHVSGALAYGSPSDLQDVSRSTILAEIRSLVSANAALNKENVRMRSIRCHAINEEDILVSCTGSTLRDENVLLILKDYRSLSMNLRRNLGSRTCLRLNIERLVSLSVF